jgi:hypothetical protein
MNSTAFPLVASASITIVSIIVGALSYRSLERESLDHTLSLGRFSTSPSYFTIVGPTVSQRCLGSFSLSVAPSSTQTTIDLQGWILVGLNERVEPVHLEAKMIFNALGQLSVSLLQAKYGNESIRFGTIGVNPISIQVYRGAAGNKPLINHSVRGPIVLSLRDGSYQLNVPPLSSFPGIPFQGGSRPLSDISVVPSSSTERCEIQSARPVDLSPLLRLADSLYQAIPKGLPGL